MAQCISAFGFRAPSALSRAYRRVHPAGPRWAESQDRMQNEKNGLARRVPVPPSKAYVHSEEGYTLIDDEAPRKRRGGGAAKRNAK
ncbi:MFS quinate transporter [Anopheles sinensis]|uniref:MFS quinate transporter n=1 Tax=Anopheles sinensis TaxID=74873 RepID=A0A084VAD9_ANOSI|nr:MFS quinate transporter [Anopheles sinensis]